MKLAGTFLEKLTDYKGRKYDPKDFFTAKDPGRGPGWFIWGRSFDEYGDKGIIRKMGWPDRPKRRFAGYNFPVQAGFRSKYEAERAMSTIQQARENPTRRRKRCWKGYRPVPGMKPYSKGSCVKANPFRVGGYPRETPEEAGYRVVQLKGRQLILQDKADGKLELWAKAPNYAGYAIYYKNNTYEFVTSVLPGQIGVLPRAGQPVKGNPPGNRWRIYEYDLWGNKLEGWEVNQKFGIGTITITDAEIDAPSKFDAIMKQNKLAVRHKDMDGTSDEDVLYFTRMSDGMPLGEMVRIEE